MAKTWYTGNYVAFTISDEDFIFIVGFSWHLVGMGYVCCSTPPWRGQCLHKIIAMRAEIDCSNMVDHIDRNKLNNQRSNLRAATQSQNSANAKVSKNNVAGIKGIRLRHNGRWQSVIKVNWKLLCLGTFDTAEEAHAAYREAAEFYFGEFANTGE